MNKEEFLKNFCDQFDDTDTSEIQLDTQFRGLEEWSSLISLAVINMVNKKYNVVITAEKLRETNTPEELFSLVNSLKD